VVTLFLPRGIVGTLAHGWRAMGARRRSAMAEKGIDPDGMAPPAPPPPPLRLGPPHPAAVRLQAAPAE
jgi:hypothetical protein